MPEVPFLLPFTLVIAAGGGVASAQYPVAMLQKLTLNEMFWTATGAWGFYEIRNANGRLYAAATQANPVRSEHLQQGASPNIGFSKLPLALEVLGGDSIIFNVIDLSGAANTVKLLFVGSLDLGGG